MTNFIRMIEGAREHVDVRWSDARAREVAARARARYYRRLRLRRAAWGAAAAAVVAGLIVGWRSKPSKPQEPAHTLTPEQVRVVRLDDGSTITARDDATRFTIRGSTSHQVDVALNSGSARLDVTMGADRMVLLEVGMAHLETTGGAFTVERDGDRARVFVESGRVRIMWGIDESVLEAGDSGEFPRVGPSEQGAGNAGGPAPSSLPSATAAPQVTSHVPAASGWRAAARDGDFDRAFRTLEAAGSGAVRDDPADLLLAADAARLSHHPAAAVPPLERVLRAHPDDPRAPLAAFTLGRVLLDELGRPGEAAKAFQQARLLAPGGPLEEDALAREVEAWSRAGDSDRAHAAAELYLSRYPAGRRLNTVRKFGDLE